MMIFDFTGGKRGKQLKEVGRFMGCGDALRWHDSTEKVPSIDRYEYHNWIESGIYNEQTGRYDCKVYRPQDFGVEAICYCMGHVFYGVDDPGKWEWAYTATFKWLIEHGVTVEG
jgi:hypothetical protein